jgi:hypothetical protein
MHKGHMHTRRGVRIRSIRGEEEEVYNGYREVFEQHRIG